MGFQNRRIAHTLKSGPMKHTIRKGQPNPSFNGRRGTLQRFWRPPMARAVNSTLALPLGLVEFASPCPANFTRSGFGKAARHQVLCAVLSQSLLANRQRLSLLCFQMERTGAGDFAASARPAPASDYGRCDSRLPSFIVGGTFSGAVSLQALPR